MSLRRYAQKNVKYFWYSSWTGREQHVSLRFTEVNQACEIIQFFLVIYYIVKGRLCGGSSRNSNLNTFLTMSRIFSKKNFICLLVTHQHYVLFSLLNLLISALYVLPVSLISVMEPMLCLCPCCRFFQKGREERFLKLLFSRSPSNF